MMIDGIPAPGPYQDFRAYFVGEVSSRRGEKLKFFDVFGDRDYYIIYSL